MIGLYPMTGQTTFLVLAPWFKSMTLDLGPGKTLKITTTGGDQSIVGRLERRIRERRNYGIRAWKRYGGVEYG
jgi:hypothetical protein